MLDICACYFPVDFEPDEKDKVTRSDLGLFSNSPLSSDWSSHGVFVNTKKVNALNSALLAGIKSEHSIGRRAHSKTLVELVIEKCNSESTQVMAQFPVRTVRGRPVRSMTISELKIGFVNECFRQLMTV